MGNSVPKTNLYFISNDKNNLNFGLNISKNIYENFECVDKNNINKYYSYGTTLIEISLPIEEKKLKVTKYKHAYYTNMMFVIKKYNINNPSDAKYILDNINKNFNGLIMAQKNDNLKVIEMILTTYNYRNTKLNDSTVIKIIKNSLKYENFNTLNLIKNIYGMNLITKVIHELGGMNLKHNFKHKKQNYYDTHMFEYNNIKVIKWCMDEGFEFVNEQNYNMLFLKIVRHCNSEILDWYVKKYDDKYNIVNPLQTHGEEYLIEALINDNVNVANWIMDNNKYNMINSLETLDKKRLKDILKNALVKNNINIANWMINNGFNIQNVDEFDLSNISRYDSVKSLEWLKNNGHSFIFDKCDPIDTAIKYNQLNVVKWYIESGLKIKFDKFSLQMEIYKNKNNKIYQELIDFLIQKNIYEYTTF